MNKKSLHAFIISSSVVSFFVTALYIGYGMSQNKETLSIIPHIEWFFTIIPIMYGLFGVLSWELKNPAIIGGILGLILSIIGRFYLDLPSKMFGHSKDEWLVHVYAIPLYALVFMYIITPLQRYFIN
jgi:hypothetical protein